MSARHVLFDLVSRGIEFELCSDGRIKVVPFNQLSDTEVAKLRSNRTLIASALRGAEIGWMDLEECAALIAEEQANMHAAVNMARAYQQEIGPPDAVVDRWRYLFAKARTRERLGQEVKNYATAILETRWPATAADLGWSERELWGISPTTRHRGDCLQLRTRGTDRVDAHGLFTGIAVSPFGITIETIDHDFARLRTSTGAVLTHPRKRWCHYAVPA